MINRDIRKALPKIRHPGNEPECGERIGARDRHVPGPIAPFDCSDDLRGSGEAAREHSVQILAGVREGNARAEPHEKRYAKLLFDRSDLFAYGSRCYVELTGRAFEGQMSGRGFKNDERGQRRKVVIATAHDPTRLPKSNVPVEFISSARSSNSL